MGDHLDDINRRAKIKQLDCGVGTASHSFKKGKKKVIQKTMNYLKKRQWGSAHE